MLIVDMDTGGHVHTDSNVHAHIGIHGVMVSIRQRTLSSDEHACDRQLGSLTARADGRRPERRRGTVTGDHELQRREVDTDAAGLAPRHCGPCEADTHTQVQLWQPRI